MKRSELRQMIKEEIRKLNEKQVKNIKAEYDKLKKMGKKRVLSLINQQVNVHSMTEKDSIWDLCNFYFQDKYGDNWIYENEMK